MTTTEQLFLGVLALVLLASGLLVIWVATATASGRIGRNAFAGIRTGSTLASDEAWLAAHRRTKRPTILAGLLLIVCALLVFVPMSLEALTVSVIAVCLMVLACGIYGAVVGSAAARAVTEAVADGEARETTGR